MNRKEVAQIKKFLTGTGGIRLQPNAAQLGIRRPLRSRALQRAAEKLMAPLLDQSTAKQFADLLAKERAKVDAALKKARARALKNGSGAQKALNAAAAQVVEGFEALAAGSPTDGSPYYDLVNRPFWIISSGDVNLEWSEIVPSNSWAKFRLALEVGYFGGWQDTYGEVKFCYAWTNPRDTFVVINVNGYIIFNGTGYIQVNGHLTPLWGINFGSLLVRGELQIFEWWNRPVTSPLEQADQRVTTLLLEVDASGWNEYSDVEFEPVFRGHDLSYTQMVVPPNSTVVFLVKATVGLVIVDGGNALANFAEGPFQVTSPAVLVTITS